MQLVKACVRYCMEEQLAARRVRKVACAWAQRSSMRYPTNRFDSPMQGGMASQLAASAAQAASEKALKQQEADRRSVVVQGVHPMANEQVVAAHFG